MRIVLGADHRGYELKDALANYLSGLGHEVTDIGTHSDESVDYPDLALAAGRAIRDGSAERGILVCGSGVGACVAANKLAGVRAAITHDVYSAHQGVEHDDMNVICLGSKVVDEGLAREIVNAFVGAQFIPEERYVRRLAKVKAMEQEGRVEHEQSPA